jgi:hypothetical protein
LAVGVSLSLVSAAHSREVLTILVPGPYDAPKEAYLSNGKTSIRLDLPQRNLSQEVEIPDGELVMAVLPKPPENPDQIAPTAPTVRIPEAWERCLLIFIPDRETKIFPFRVIPIDISGSKLANGKTLVCNLTDKDIGVRLDQRKAHVEPGQSATIEAPRRDFGPYPVAIDCLIKGEKTPRAICRSMWQHDPDSRQILFVIPQDGREIPRVWGVLDSAKSETRSP